MTQKTDTYLDRIVADKREELAAANAATSASELEARVAEAPQVRSFIEALREPALSLIAEVKKASPSKGLLRADFNAVDLARQYASGGASAISVLTDEKHFQGSLEHLAAIRQVLPDGPPLLRKDFVFDEYQVLEARAYGADAVLLIVAMLEQSLLEALMNAIRALGMTSLVEVHDEAEIERAAAAGSELIGINNRDLRTFDVDLVTTERLRPLAPADSVVVAESGIFTRDDMRRLETIDVHAVLVGEALVKEPDPAAKVRELLR